MCVLAARPAAILRLRGLGHLGRRRVRLHGRSSVLLLLGGAEHHALICPVCKLGVGIIVRTVRERWLLLDGTVALLLLEMGRKALRVIVHLRKVVGRRLVSVHVVHRGHVRHVHVHRAPLRLSVRGVGVLGRRGLLLLGRCKGERRGGLLVLVAVVRRRGVGALLPVVHVVLRPVLCSDERHRARDVLQPCPTTSDEKKKEKKRAEGGEDDLLAGDRTCGKGL